MEKDGKAGDRAEPPRDPNSMLERWKTDRFNIPLVDDGGFLDRQLAEFERLRKLHPGENFVYHVKL
ncbi:MAG: hypothetical protein K6A65_01240 [Succinivibrionaceae bacterium]|nr:hypothetical protein [Succinivibrionaceae bacterium]